jgi:hypothetical protein
MLSATDFPDPFVNELFRILISGVFLVSLAFAAAGVEWLIAIFWTDVDADTAQPVSKENFSPIFAAATITHSNMLRVLRRTCST